MCGISAIISNKFSKANDLKLINDVIRHRGPDDEGFCLFSLENKTSKIFKGNDTPKSNVEKTYTYWPVNHINDNLEERFNVGLGHRRLSILDLTPAGHNPMSYDNDRYWITYNGEVYNFIELREELKVQGYKFKTNSDTEVIIASYKHWGSDCLNRFTGMWAFVIYDSLSQVLFISRDRYGIKPLYYHIDNENTIYFASEIKQFTQIPGWESRMNHDQTLHFLIHTCTDHTDETMFSNVYQVRGGYMIECEVNKLKNSNDGRLPFIKWYNPKLSNIFKGSIKDAVSVFRELFLESIDLHMRADVKIGATLSGGLDSSAVVGSISKLKSKENPDYRQPVFSSCSIYDEVDERKWVEIMNKSIITDPHFIYPSANIALDSMEKMLWHHDIPYDNQSPYLAYNVMNVIKENGIKVILNGQGSDEYLGGYMQFIGAHLVTHLKNLQPYAIYSEMQKFRNFHGLSFSGQMNSVLAALLPNWIKSLKSRYIKSSIKELDVVNLKNFNYSNIRPYDFIPIKIKDYHDISELMTFYNPLPKYLRWEDRNSMAHGIECRVPFLNHKIIEFVDTLPLNFIQREGMTKWILRESMKGIMPDQIRYRKDKKGYVTPEQKWMTTEVTALYRDKLKQSVESSKGLINYNIVKSFENMVNGKEQYSTVPSRVILFGKWMEVFNVKT
ncbi:MAG: asparagine synthase (glutamine-hydrolyzing) [Saprospiraceae bacterium]|nr:asparagine synthase (glutamine-hydrolyzing) [Saprospiraceae bacterium]